jgi:hypothetical protein
VLKTGDTMTGHLFLPTAPAAANAVRKDYVDAADNTLSGEMAGVAVTANAALPKSGGTMTGHIALVTAPAAANAVRKDYVDTADALKVTKSGDTMTGDLYIQKASPGLRFDKTAGTATWLVTSQAGVTRWAMQLGDGAAESGGNAGSNFVLGRYSDAGAGIDSAIYISRATANVTFSGGIAVGSNGISTTGNCTFSGITRQVGLTQIGPGPGFTGLNVTTGIGYAGGGTQYGMGFRPQADNTNILFFENVAGAGVGAIAESSTGVSYNVSSSAELKEDLQSFDAGNIIDDTRVYDFAWKSTGERAYGVVAQQAVEVYPQAVTRSQQDGHDEFWGVDYSKYVPVILQELQALRARVRELEAAAGTKPPIVDPKGKH